MPSCNVIVKKKYVKYNGVAVRTEIRGGEEDEEIVKKTYICITSARIGCMQVFSIFFSFLRTPTTFLLLERGDGRN